MPKAVVRQGDALQLDLRAQAAGDGDAADVSDGLKVREKEQYIRDDLVRAGHRSPFTRPDDYSHIDEAKVRAEVMRFAPTVVGPGVVKAVVVTKQTSQKVLTLPPVRKAPTHEIIP